MDQVFLGIDLGTTTTLVARAIEGERAIDVKILDINQDDGKRGQTKLSYLPSVAYFPAGGEPPLVGLAAKIKGPQEDASRYVRAVKRQMGRRVLLPVVEKHPRDVSALYLTHALREGRRAFPKTGIIFTVTVPASFTTNQRADTLLALRKACQEAGLDDLGEKDEGEIFISEPVAAMLAFLNKELELPADVRKLNLSRDEGNRVVVYDIGGGTLDLTLVFIEPRQKKPVQSLADVRMCVEAISDYYPFGGEDFDSALAEKLLHRRLLERFPDLDAVTLTSEQRMGVRLQLMNLAEGIKEKLGEQIKAWQARTEWWEDSAAEPNYYYKGEIGIRGQPYFLDGKLTDSEYRDIVEGLRTLGKHKNLLTPLKDLLDKQHWTPADLDGLLLVGGMAQLPIVEETVREFWGNDKVWRFDPPHHAVATGAAIYSFLRGRYPDFSLEEPAADAYYVRLEDEFDLILPANTQDGEQKPYKLPVDADKLILQIFAGEEPEHGAAKETIYHTLIYQGGTILDLRREYPEDTPVWVQMRYVGESGTEHSKVPWIYVWVANKDGEPLFHRRYSDFVQEARDE